MSVSRLFARSGIFTFPRWPFGSREGGAGSAGEFGDDEIVGFAEERGGLRLREGLRGFDSDPFGAREVGGGNDTGALGEVGKFFGVCLQREPKTRRLEGSYGEHLTAYFEDEIVFPLHLFGDAGK